MASGPYSFIDIAVLEDVRGRFAAGDALSILSIDLEEVIWANGPGAALLGYGDIEQVMGGSPGLSFAARRQISATPGFPRMGRNRPVAVRVASGTTSRVVPFLASGITLPDGEPAILLAVPAQKPESLNDAEAAARAIEGFGEAGYFAALLDADGRLEAASDGFAELSITQETLDSLVGDVARERDRLVKRMIRAGNVLIPAGIARLTDEPARHLLIAVTEPVEEQKPDANIEPEEDDEAPHRDAGGQSLHAAHPTPDAFLDEDLPAPSDADLPERITESQRPPEQSVGTEKPRDADDWYFAREDEGDRIEAPVEPLNQIRSPVAPVEESSDPVRFVWRTDASGAFSSVSEEFVRAVGPASADVIGKSFHDVSAAFNLDPTGEIAGLLARRDTWSGRSVLWPIEGTDLVAPVDLAALPVYNRDRVFEGFRGFGVVRMGDVTADDTGRGRALSGTPAPDQDVEEIRPGDPFRGEVPAIALTDRPERRASDKVIRLAEHRPAQEPDKRLSPGERSAFEEIRARLRKDFDTAQADKAADETSEAPARSDAADSTPEERAIDASIEQPAQEALSETPEFEIIEEIEIANDDDLSREPESPAQDQDDEEPALESEAALPPVLETPAPLIAATGFLPSAFAGNDNAEKDFDTDLIAGLPLALLVHAGDALYFANREFLDLTGYASLEQIRREGGLDRLFVDKGPERDTETEASKLRLRTLGGDEFPVDAHLQSIRWKESSALLLALRRVEQPTAPALQPPSPEAASVDNDKADERVAEMRTIIDTATDGVVLITADGNIRSISRPAEALFGLDSVEVEGNPFVSLFAIESQRAAGDYLAGLSGNGVASVLNDGREVIGREAQGRFIPLFMTIGKLPGDSGYCAVLRDITQWKRAEEELTQARAQAERASSQKTEFLARVSHEVRTPLNAIIGFSELMMDEKFGPIGSDRYRDYLRDINRSGNHVLDLVNDLLDISKIEAGEQEMNYEAVSLNDTLAESVAMMQPQANRDRVIIRSSLASRLPEVVADLRSVRQIALNLLSNAIRYTQPGGQVIVSTSYEPSGDVNMRVRDTGIGMTLSEIDQALKPFKQINALKRGRHDGTGLGLPLTKAMVEANRARFVISSTPGEGTMVEVTFPSTRVLAD